MNWCFFLLLWCFPLLGADECSTLFAGREFPQKELEIVLKKYKIPKEAWRGIQRALDGLEVDAEKFVLRKADQMERNPYLDPKEELIIGRLYKEVYFEIFNTVMKEYGIEDEARIFEMFSELEGEKAAAIFRCYQNRP